MFDDAEGTEDAESKDDEKDEKSAALDPADTVHLAASTNQGKAMFDLTMTTANLLCLKT